MSINHYSTAATGAMYCSQSAGLSFNLNNEEGQELLEEQVSERGKNSTSTQFEQVNLFEKPLTPSDVGKLNRLVIPKQHAEKYFPLNGGGGGDSGEKGLLLGFEDEVGKPWRFRYSYWNSSQSYVLTKGWSRFVKEKRLDAGDVVLFARHRMDFGRFFIGWRRRNTGGGQEGGVPAHPPFVGGGWRGVVYPGHPYPNQHQGASSSVVYQTDHCSSNAEEQRRTRSGNSKRLRLFGVNLEWAEEESEPSTPVEGLAMSSQLGPTHQHQEHQSSSSDHQRTWI